jgi:hypothetical protein
MAWYRTFQPELLHYRCGRLQSKSQLQSRESKLEPEKNKLKVNEGKKGKKIKYQMKIIEVKTRRTQE